MIKNGFDIECFGCGVCKTSCPVKAIKIQFSNDGFWVPVIDIDKCIECNLCDKICSYLDNEFLESADKLDEPKAYAVIHKDKEVLENSTSGGASMGIAQVLLKNGYNLIGVRYNTDKNIAEHFITNDIEQFKETRNSKYIQSYTSEAFSQINKEDKYVVFGTPCQIDSLKRLMNKKRTLENFIFVDLFCHGVPSYLLWNSYLNHWLKKNEKIEKPLFRDKSNGWHNYTLTLKTNKRNISNSIHNNDFFQNMFLGNYTLNKPCYTCKFKEKNSAADLRMGDLWGGKYSHIESGITGVVAYTERGNTIIDSLSEFCNVNEETLDVIMAGQLKNDLKIPATRNKILEELKQDKSLKMVYYKNVKKMWIRNLVTYSVKKIIKKLRYNLTRR